MMRAPNDRRMPEIRPTPKSRCLLNHLISDTHPILRPCWILGLSWINFKRRKPINRRAPDISARPIFGAGLVLGARLVLCTLNFRRKSNTKFAPDIMLKVAHAVGIWSKRKSSILNTHCCCTHPRLCFPCTVNIYYWFRSHLRWKSIVAWDHYVQDSNRFFDS